MHTHRMSTTNGINKSSRPKSRLIERRLLKRPLEDRNPDLHAKLTQMRLAIAPIVHVLTGEPAPHYPYTMLSLFLLTESQLDSLASFYSQRTPDVLTYAYPQTMAWDAPFLDTEPSLPDDCKLTDLERLKVKMRMFARFVGMRGAETPVWEYERAVELLARRTQRSVRQEWEGGLKTYRGPRMGG
ncbi:hypothetical protein IQ07DRAFT_583162 [Pyrenochaeta sp. DS3sAY3a]|nr:hypothetical protein IQ07DRAFT_583162 [Pyrenochaeta sp. DS3sAY3a]